LVTLFPVGEKPYPDASQVRREVGDELLDWLDSSSGSGSTPKPSQDLDPVLVLLSGKNENEKKKDTSENKIALTKDKVTYEIQKEVDGLEKVTQFSSTF
jgi:hypothetical protein